MTYLTQIGGALSLSGALGYFSSNYISQNSKNSANRGILWIGRNAKTISLLMAAVGVVILVVNYAKRFFLDVEGQLEELFSSSSPVKKIFVIDKIKIGIIFNPNDSSVSTLTFAICDRVALIAEQPIPKKIKDRIEASLLKGHTFSTIAEPLFKGVPTFQYFGF